ncbi:MAG: hypothetical protein RL030_1727, partial [Pseudomonadota bacterium]
AALDSAIEQIPAVQKTANDLKAAGYAPAMRFGDYAVTATDADGEVKFFSMVDTKLQANLLRMQVKRDLPGMTVTANAVDKESFKMFGGMSPDTVELFAKFLEVDKTDAFKQFVALAASSRSALKHMLERKGVAGFSQNLPQVLAAFITGNSRGAARNINGEEVAAAMENVKKQANGDVSEQAAKLHNYMQNPTDDGAKVRGFMFAYFMGGSVASALVNLTQPIMMTAPYLHQFAGNQTAEIMGRAAKTAATGETTNKELKAAMTRAANEGVTDTHEYYQMMQEAGGSGNVPVRAAMKAWGAMFGAAEKFNRKITFAAAFETAQGMTDEQIRATGATDAYSFAKRAVDETQGVYCVDDDTECLTLSGWKRRSNLEVGEAVYAVDGTGRLVESTLLDVHVFTGNIPATVLTSHGGERFSMVVTAEHDCLIQNYNSRDRKWQSLRKVKTKDLKPSHHLLRVPLGDATKREPVYSDDEVSLFAWVAAEGHLFSHRNVNEKRGVGLTQSFSHNPDYVAEIDALLTRLGGHFNRKTAVKKERGDTMVTWQLRKPLWLKVHEALPGKMVRPPLVAKLTIPQMRLFVDTFAKGDGCFGERGGPVISQKDIGNLDALQAMCVLSGTNSAKVDRRKLQKYECGTLCVGTATKRTFVKQMEMAEIALPLAWCPETEHGTWIARRGGYTFVTGNSSHNRPAWARGTAGALLFTFKQFSIAYLEFFSRLPPKQQLIAIALLMAMAGAEGLPFAEDLEDLIDTLGQKMGYGTNTKKTLHRLATAALGEAGAQFALHGISGLSGLPMDVAGRIGMGNLIPGTKMLNPSVKDKSGEALEIAGPLGGLAKNALSAFDQGDPSRAFPSAFANAAKALEMFQTGQYRDTKGQKVQDVGTMDAAMKLIGFQPQSVAAGTRHISENMRDVDTVRRVESEIVTQWAEGIRSHDPDVSKAARERLAEWNADNPELPIKIKMAQIVAKVKAENLTRDQRFMKTASPEMRRKMLAEAL